MRDAGFGLSFHIVFPPFSLSLSLPVVVECLQATLTTIPSVFISSLQGPAGGKLQVVQQAGGDISFLLPAAASTEVHAGSSANTATYCVSLYTANLRNGGTSGQVSAHTLWSLGMHNVVNHWAPRCSREAPMQAGPGKNAPLQNQPHAGWA